MADPVAVWIDREKQRKIAALVRSWSGLGTPLKKRKQPGLVIAKSLSDTNRSGSGTKSMGNGPWTCSVGKPFFGPQVGTLTEALIAQEPKSPRVTRRVSVLYSGLHLHTAEVVESPAACGISISKKGFSSTTQLSLPVTFLPSKPASVKILTFCPAKFRVQMTLVLPQRAERLSTKSPPGHDLRTNARLKFTPNPLFHVAKREISGHSFLRIQVFNCDTLNTC